MGWAGKMEGKRVFLIPQLGMVLADFSFAGAGTVREGFRATVKFFIDRAVAG